MDATPSGVLDNLHFVGGRMGCQIAGVVGQFRQPALFNMLKRVGEGHFAVTMMVAVGFAVGGNIGNLGPRAILVEGASNAPGEGDAADQKALEGHGSRNRPIVEEDREGAPTRQVDHVGAGRINARPTHISPDRLAQEAAVTNLAGFKHGEQHTMLGHKLKGFEIHRRLRQPHPFGATAKAMDEILDAPTHLRHLIAARGERHDDVVVALRHRRTAPKEAGALLIGDQDCLVDGGRFFFKPSEQRGADVEADAAVVIDDPHDLVLAVENTRGRVRLVAFSGDALVPVVIRVG